MIYESNVWKDDLLKRAERLDRRARQKRWTDRSIGLLEHEVMVGFFSIRKLIESLKVSDDIARDRVAVGFLPATGHGATKLNRHRIDRLFDFERMKDGQLQVGDLCNQVIHSLVFTFISAEDLHIESFLVASDWKKNDRAVLVRLQATAELFRRVGNNYPNSMELVRNAAGDYDVTIG